MVECVLVCLKNTGKTERTTKTQAILLYYRPQRSWGKVIFLVACVNDSVHGGGEYLGRYPPGRYTPQAGTPPAGIHPLAGTPPSSYTPPASTPPPGAVHAGRYGQQAGGTHPTGMHSCCELFESHMDREEQQWDLQQNWRMKKKLVIIKVDLILMIRHTLQ